MKRLFFILFFAFCSFSLFAQHAEWSNYLENKMYEKIITTAGDLQPADSADFNKMFILGQAYEGLLKYRDAYNCFKHCYSLDSTRMDMLITLARMATGLGRTKEAENYYLMVLATDSTNFYANYQLARLNVSLERYKEGLYYYSFLLEKDTTNAVLLRAVGDCFKGLNSLFFALEFYRAAYNANVENASLASLLINTLLILYAPKENEYANDALSVCDTALFYNPGNITLRQNQAMSHYVLNNYRQADSAYTALLEDKDSSYLTLKYCGCARYYSRKWYDAIEVFEKAFELNPTETDICVLLGSALGKTYDPALAFQFFEKAESLMEPNPYWSRKIIEFRAETYSKTGNYQKANELYYQIWKTDETELSWIQIIQRRLSLGQLDKMSDENQQRSLFINFLYTTEILKRQKTENTERELKYMSSILKKFEEEMFFRGVNSLPMLSPDNKKNTLSKEKLKELTQRISEY